MQQIHHFDHRDWSVVLSGEEKNIPGGNAAKDSVKVVAAQREEDSWGRGPELRSMLVALTVRVDEMTNLWQQLFDQHGLIQT